MPEIYPKNSSSFSEAELNNWTKYTSDSITNGLYKWNDGK